MEPMPVDIGYHSPTPKYEGQTCIEKSCKYLDGKPCYYDGSSLNAQRYFDILVSEGSDALWIALEKYYNIAIMEILIIQKPLQLESTIGQISNQRI